MTTILNFENWQRTSIEETGDNEIIDCPFCCEGTIYSECECCGNETEEECGTCDGGGRVRFGDLLQREKLQAFTKETYFKELYSQLQKLESYAGINPYSVLIDNGYIPFTTLSKHWRTGELGKGRECVKESHSSQEYQLN